VKSNLRQENKGGKRLGDGEITVAFFVAFLSRFVLVLFVLFASVRTAKNAKSP
jgi:hypothetical protein